MNWKYTLIGTGATALATFVATSPTGPGDARTTTRAAVTPTPQALDVQREAERLGYRLRGVPLYEEPARNLFRFESRPAPRPPAPQAGEAQVPQPASEEPSARPMPQLTLIGTAGDGPDGATPITAILSTPSGVLLVREGDTIGSEYRVTKVDTDGVTIEAAGSASSFTLRFPQSR